MGDRTNDICVLMVVVQLMARVVSEILLLFSPKTQFTEYTLQVQ